MVCEQPSGKFGHKVIAGFKTAAVLTLVLSVGGCIGVIDDWNLRKQAVTDGVDEAARAEALVPRLPIIRFDLGETRPSAAAEAELRSVAGDLTDLNPDDFVVLVEGHTDATGPTDLNERISEQRAQSVADILIEEGVDPDLIKIGSFGPDLPVANNVLEDGSDHPPGRRFNRRVEVMVAPRSATGERDAVTASAG